MRTGQEKLRSGQVKLRREQDKLRTEQENLRTRQVFVEDKDQDHCEYCKEQNNDV